MVLGKATTMSNARALRDGAVVAGLLFGAYLFVFVAPAARTFGFDAFAYWANPISDPYRLTTGAFGAFLYSPVAARLFAPAALVAWPTFLWLWTALLLGTAIWLGGRRWLWVLAFPPVALELYHGNIHLLIAAAIALGFRYPVAWAFVLLTKVTPGIGLIWFAVRREWRQLGIVAVATGVLVGISLVVDPGLWRQWIDRELVHSLAAGAGPAPYPDPVVPSPAGRGGRSWRGVPSTIASGPSPLRRRSRCRSSGSRPSRRSRRCRHSAGGSSSPSSARQGRCPGGRGRRGDRSGGLLMDWRPDSSYKDEEETPAAMPWRSGASTVPATEPSAVVVEAWDDEIPQPTRSDELVAAARRGRAAIGPATLHVFNLIVFAAAVLGALAGAAVAWMHVMNDPLADAHAYFEAAARLNAGAPLYPADADPNGNQIYLYPPLLAMVLRPLALLGYPLFAAAWEAIVILAFVLLLRKLGVERRATWLAIGLLGIPIGWALSVAQAHVPLTLLLAVGQPWSIALAANLKLTPVLIALWWLGRRDFESFFAFLVWMALFALAQLAPGRAGHVRVLRQRRRRPARRRPEPVALPAVAAAVAGARARGRPHHAGTRAYALGLAGRRDAGHALAAAAPRVHADGPASPAFGSRTGRVRSIQAIEGTPWRPPGGHRDDAAVQRLRSAHGTPCRRGCSRPTNDDRSAGLDALRSIACLLVVVFHLRTMLTVDFGPLNPVIEGGNSGVFLFFALSGYLLYRPFLRGNVDLRSYAIKRAARILPGYFVALVALVALTRNPLAFQHPLPYLTITLELRRPAPGSPRRCLDPVRRGPVLRAPADDGVACPGPRDPAAVDDRPRLAGARAPAPAPDPREQRVAGRFVPGRGVRVRARA